VGLGAKRTRTWDMGEIEGWRAGGPEDQRRTRGQAGLKGRRKGVRGIGQEGRGVLRTTGTKKDRG